MWWQVALFPVPSLSLRRVPGVGKVAAWLVAGVVGGYVSDLRHSLHKQARVQQDEVCFKGQPTASHPQLSNM